MPNCALESAHTMTPEVRRWSGFSVGLKPLTFAVVVKRMGFSSGIAPGMLGSNTAMPVRPA